MTEERDNEARFAAPQSIASGRLSERTGLVLRPNAAPGDGDAFDEDCDSERVLLIATQSQIPVQLQCR